MSEPIGRFTAVNTISRGLREAPILRQGLGVTWMFAAVGAMGRVVVPILIQQSIDRGIVGVGQVDLVSIFLFGAIAAVGLTVAATCQRIAILRLGSRSERALYDLRVRLIGHIHRLSLADHNEQRRGSLTARVTSDIDTLTQFFSWGGLAWLLDGTLMLIIAAVMLSYNWVLALTAFVVAAPLVIVLRLVQKRLVVAYERARSRNADMTTSISEVVSGSRTIRAYQAGEYFEGLTRASVHRRASAQIRANIISAFLFPSGEVFSVLTIASVVSVGVWIGPAGGLSAGAVVGFVFLAYRFLEPVAQFTEVLDQTQTAVAGLRRVMSVLDMPVGPPEAQNTVDLPAGVLDVVCDGVSFAYRSRLEDQMGTGALDEAVIKNLDVRIPAGQHVALVGATGSGKTTVARLIARFADPTFGEIRIGGVPLHLVANEDLRQRVAVVSQEPFLFDDTLMANVCFARPAATETEVWEVIQNLGLTEWAQGLRNGLSTVVGGRGDVMSAGERQLIALIRVGLINPGVLILDEATSSVDARSEVEISRALASLAKGRTTVSIAHRLSTAARADRVLVLDHGVLVQDGSHLELVAIDGPYRQLYEDWVRSTRSSPTDHLDSTA
jgi:putative ABC transport system ATP-binding protein